MKEDVWPSATFPVFVVLIRFVMSHVYNTQQCTVALQQTKACSPWCACPKSRGLTATVFIISCTWQMQRPNLETDHKSLVRLFPRRLMKSAFLFSLNLSSRVLSSWRLSDLFPSSKLLTLTVLGQREKANLSWGPKDSCEFIAAF